MLNIFIIILAIIITMSVIIFSLFGIDLWKTAHRCRRIRKRIFRILVPVFAVIDIVIIAFFLWISDYYRAGETALAALQSDSIVSVERTDTGWFFNGPSEDEVMVFYPGARVEETAYAPLLHRLAEEEMDVYLIRMPLHLAFLGINAADSVIRDGSYESCYISGHSLGGAMAAGYAAEHENIIDKMILLAAYPTKETSVDTDLIYGSEDGVLNLSRVKKAEGLVTGCYNEYCIEGGNHSQFGDYGEQAGDGKAGIAAQDQQELTIREIRRFIGKE